MNWLQICRRIRKECGVAGTDTSPTTVVGQSGEMLAIVNWCNSAWLAIQGNAKWDWQWENPSNIVIPAGTNFVAGAVSANRYVLDQTWAGSRRLHYLPWSEFRDVHPLATLADGDPQVWSVRPDRAIVVSAKPTADLTLTVERYRNPAEMPTGVGADADSPLLPAHQHEAIVWRAVMFYAGHDEAGSLYQHARAEFARLMGEAAIDDLPDFEAGAALC